MVVQLDTCLQLQTQSRTIEYPALKGTHKDHQSSAPGPAHGTPRIPLSAMLPSALSKHILNSDAESVSLGSQFQCPNTLGGKNLFLILKLPQHNFRPFPCVLVLVTSYKLKCPPLSSLHEEVFRLQWNVSSVSSPG